MSDPNPFDLLLDQIRLIVREEIQAAKLNGEPEEPDKLLTVEEAAAMLGGDPEKQVDWLYAHSKQLGFAKHISRRKLRFSSQGLRRWLAARK